MSVNQIFPNLPNRCCYFGTPSTAEITRTCWTDGRGRLNVTEGKADDHGMYDPRLAQAILSNEQRGLLLDGWIN